jgi:sterol desaturase/sphingolipid hydroxylase (fatty acid hydroxylase superfamily)
MTASTIQSTWAPPNGAPRVPSPTEPTWRRSSISLLRFVGAAAAIAISLVIESGVLFAVAALFVITVPFEKLYPRQRGQRIRRPLVGTDISFALMSPLLNVVGIAAIIGIGGLSFFWLPGLALRPFVQMLPAAALPVVGFLLFDFLGYWTHRWAHEVPFMWRFHSVHHSPEHMDWISGFRVHPFDGVLIAPAFFFLIGAGFGAEITGVLAIFQVVLGLFFHANVRVRWRLLDKIVANPEFHHWHHANEADAIGHNYGPALPWWDLAFGTFFMPRSTRRPQHYGVDDYPARSVGALLTHPCRGARRHVRLLWHPVTAVRVGWRGTRQLLCDIRRSTLRPTRSIRTEKVEGCATTNASLFTTPRTIVR